MVLPPDAKRSLYEVLGVAPDANLPTIRASYRRKAVQLHPDKGGNREEFNELQAAYVVLCNVALRQRYDETGKTDVPESAKAGGYAAQTRPASRDDHPVVAPVKPARPLRPDELPPALRALVEHRTITSEPLPEEFEQPVCHIIVSETKAEKRRYWRLVDSYPMIENNSLLPGQVLLQMRAVPLSMADLLSEGRYACGDVFGMQGIGQVRHLGPEVNDLKVGDWVLPLHEVDEDGDIDTDAPPPGTGRSLMAWKAVRCARLDFAVDSPFTIAQMALAKSIGTAYHLAQEYASKLGEGDAVMLNCANGVIGQILIQLFAKRQNLFVYAVMREHPGMEWIKGKLQGLGATRVFNDEEDFRSILEEAALPLPMLALDGVGGSATARLAQALSKHGDIVSFGTAGGESQSALNLNVGKKWKGNLLQFSFDEWLNRDVKAHAKRLNDMLIEVAGLLKAKQMQLVIKEYQTERFNMAHLNAKQIGRTHAVVVHLPRLQQNIKKEAPDIAVALTSEELEEHKKRVRSWDLAFLEWEESGADEQHDYCRDKESSLFNANRDASALHVQEFVEASQPTPIALELGARQGTADAILFWLPGKGEMPQEHANWLERLCAATPGLRAVILEPPSSGGLKWFDLSDHECVQLGLRYGVVDDQLENPEGDPAKSRGSLTFAPLLPAEIAVLQQVECAALGLKRRAMLEEQAMRRKDRFQSLPFCFGGFGQGGTVALFAAQCLMELPVDAVIFSHSGVPAASMLGKRLGSLSRSSTKLYGVYDKDDQEVPTIYPETLVQMLKLMRCKTELHWLEKGDGHDFLKEASEAVSECALRWIDDLNHRMDMMKR
eukprot:TRINITY_DN73436_c0_g1_i1.p1 TRINITY_DN73436_c0_g1~~TRINITY_DN73436_c0_g1_i1.p1  ORF type:complete len:842 (+),score=170.53 TRINITY_DN73436_c0_g1_i1:25-2526(+)